MLLVGLPEESRVIKACPQHSLMAVTNDALRIAVGIQYRQKVRQQFVIAVFDCKIFLVIAHHRDQNFFRKREEFGIKAAEDGGRKFGEIDNCIKQILVFPPACAGYGASGGIERFANPVFAGVPAQHIRIAQRTHIWRSSTWYRNLAICQNPVAARSISRLDSEHFNWDHLVIEHGSRSARISRAVRPFFVISAARYSPLAEITILS